MNNSSNLILRSQSNEWLDATAALGMIREVFDDIAVNAATRTASEENLVTTLARASASEIECRLDAMNGLAKDADGTDLIDAVGLAVGALRFSYAQFGAIAVVADTDLADRALSGAARISSELLDSASHWTCARAEEAQS